tara:strand:+ start:2708 stop:2983 length:276 start_codon:yes stop_codon:yes gene_type:complete
MTWKEEIKKRRDGPLDERAGLADNEGREVPPSKGDKETKEEIDGLLKELTTLIEKIPIRYLEDERLAKKAIDNMERAINNIERIMRKRRIV